MRALIQRRTVIGRPALLNYGAGIEHWRLCSLYLQGCKDLPSWRTLRVCQALASAPVPTTRSVVLNSTFTCDGSVGVPPPPSSSLHPTAIRATARHTKNFFTIPLQSSAPSEPFHELLRCCRCGLDRSCRSPRTAPAPSRICTCNGRHSPRRARLVSVPPFNDVKSMSVRSLSLYAMLGDLASP